MNFILFIFYLFYITSLLSASDHIHVYSINFDEFKAVKLNDDLKGNAYAGKKLFISRKVNCLSCHEAPIIDEKFQGNFGPSLYKIGERYTKDELRLRIINPKIINSDSIMPSYFDKIKNPRTPKNFLNQTILSAQEVEDLVEYLYSLK